MTYITDPATGFIEAVTAPPGTNKSPVVEKAAEMWEGSREN